MNSVFSVEDLSDPIWAAAAESLTAAEQGLGMTRSQSEWAFQRLLEEMAASGSPRSSSSATGNPIVKTSQLQSQPSISRPEDVDGEHIIEIQKPQNHDYNPNHLRHSDDNGNRVQKPQIHDRIYDYLHNTDDKGHRNHASPSVPAGLPIDSDQYRAILKSKLDLACAAAVALRASNVKPELSGASANHQKQPEISGSQAQGSPIAQTSPSASSASIPTVPTSRRKTDALVRQTSGSSRDDSDDEEFEGDTETTDLDPTDIKRARRMLSNRESARRSRRRKQEQMTELETQAGQLRVEHSSLLKRLSDMNHKYDTAAVDNRILKADIETLRTKVKMAEDTVKRMTGMNPLLMARPTMPSSTVHIENVPADCTRVSAVPSANHILKPVVPNILPHEPISRVQNNFSSSGLIPPSAKLARSSRVENLTNNPQHVVSADNLQKQVTNSGTRDQMASGTKTSEMMSGRMHDVAKNNQPQR